MRVVSKMYGFSFESEGRCSEVVFDDGRKAHLSPKTRTLLAYSIENQGKYRTSPELLDVLWREDPDASCHSVRVRINEIWGVIEADPLRPTRLVRKRGFGYCYNPSVPEEIITDPNSVLIGDILFNDDYRRVFRLTAVAVTGKRGKAVAKVEKEIHLRRNQYDLLRCLASAPLGTEWLPIELMEAIWGHEVSFNNLKQEISALRRSIGHQHVVTIGGKGGQFVDYYTLAS